MATRRQFLTQAAAWGLAMPFSTGAQAPPSAQLIELRVTEEQQGVLNSEYIGWSYEKKSMVLSRLFGGKNRRLIDLWSSLGQGILRIGGNTVEEFAWNSEGTGGKPGKVSKADVDSLAEFARATNRRVLYALNAAGNTSPALAAAESEYVKQALGANLFGFEVGNESNDYAQKYKKMVSVKDYVAVWKSYRSAIMDKCGNVLLTGPATSTPYQIDAWTIPFEEETYPWNGVLTQHYYRGKGTLPEATAERLISPDLVLRSASAKLQQESVRRQVPWRLTETNSYWAGGSPGVSDSHASALWSLDHIFNTAQYGCSGLNFHCGNNTTYSAVVDIDGKVSGVRPLFYGLRLAALFGTGTMLRTTMSSDVALNVSSYAIRRNDGSRGILVNNKIAQEITVRILLPEATQYARSWLLTAPKLTSRDKVTLDGASIGADEQLPVFSGSPIPIAGSNLTVTVPGYSALLVSTGSAVRGH